MTDIRFIFGVLLLAQAQAHFLLRFSSKVELAPCDTHELPCWIWTGSGDGRYGHIEFMGHRFKVHRFVFLAFKGTVRRHEVVDHECNRTACCQPGHLTATTQSKNMKRCFAVGRGCSPLVKEFQS